MTPEELREIGEAMFGPRWQTLLARALPANPRTVRRWLAGGRAIRPLAEARIRSLAATFEAKAARKRRQQEQGEINNQKETRSCHD